MNTRDLDKITFIMFDVIEHVDVDDVLSYSFLTRYSFIIDNPHISPDELSFIVGTIEHTSKITAFCGLIYTDELKKFKDEFYEIPAKSFKDALINLEIVSQLNKFVKIANLKEEIKEVHKEFL